MNEKEIKTALLLQLTKSVADFGLLLSEVAQTQNATVEKLNEYLPQMPEAEKQELLTRTRNTSIQIGGLQEKLELLRGLIR